MSDKSDRLWESMKKFCMENPGKIALIVRPEGDFTLTFRPKQERLKGRLFVDFETSSQESK